MPLSSSRSHYLAVVTLLDQLDPKEYHWGWLSVILQDRSLHAPNRLDFLFYEPSIAFLEIVSKFLMDRDRAGSLWVNPQMYVNLEKQILRILRDK